MSVTSSSSRSVNGVYWGDSPAADLVRELLKKERAAFFGDPHRMKQFDPFRLDASNGCLWRGGVSIAMPPKPFAVLRYLVENPGRLITHDELLDALWPETYVQPQVLRTYMLELRKVLGDDAGQPRYIQTLPKRGYRFVAPVSEWEGAGSMPAPAVHGGKPSGFVNRDHELARLNAEFEPAAGGERRVVFITGEAGIGKTALADAFCRPGISPSRRPWRTAIVCRASEPGKSTTR